MTTFRPSFYMVGMHFLKIKFLFANCTLMILLFVGGKGITAIESTNGELLFFSGQQILVNAGFLRYILVAHQTLNL